MAQIRLIPSTYSGSSQYISVTNAANMYTNTDSTNYADIQSTRNNSTTTYYAYIRGFNFSDVPSDVIINSFTVKIKGYNSTTGTTTLQLYNGTSAISNATASAFTTSTTTRTFSNGSLTWEQIKGYGSNFGIRVPVFKTRNATGHTYVYGAEIEVDYTIPVYHNVSFQNDTEDVTTVPSTTQSVLEGSSPQITFNGISSLDDYTIEDNGTDISSSLVYVEPSTEKSSVLGTYSLISGGFSSGGESYFSGLSGNGVDASQTTSNYYSSGSGTIAVFTYDFNFSGIPQSATITRVYCQVNGHAESTSQDNEYMCVRLILGTTANTISDELNFKSVGTSNTTQTIEATTLPSASDIGNLKLMCRLGYYGGAINGATCYVEYADETGLGSYVYTISNIQTGHTIAISDAGGVFYAVNASSNYTGATVSPATKQVREGRNHTITITTQNAYEFTVTDNGVDVTGSVVPDGGNFSYTITNVTATHNIVVNEATKFLVLASSKSTGTTISPSSNIPMVRGLPSTAFR